MSNRSDKMSFNPLDESELIKIFKTSTKYPDRLIKREDKNHEFKTSFNMAGAAMYLKSIAAFANNEGGYIIFGVKDKPHILCGLKDKALESFSMLKVEDLTQKIHDYFAPDIEWKHCLFEYKEMFFGIIYIYPAKVKPVVCKKLYDCSDERYSLKESDIYYRYGGRSQRIKYPELQRLIDEKRAAEERQWMKFLMKAAHIGVENACLLDLSKGEITGEGGRVVIDEELLKKIAFIKEGEFVENGGTPTLRLVGDVHTIEAGKTLVTKTKHIVKAIEQTDIVEGFLKNENVDNPVEYIKRICSSTTGNLPVYYYLKMSGRTKEEMISDIESVTVRGQAKRTLLMRLKGEKVISTRQFPAKETEASRRRKKYSDCWINESVPDFTAGEKNLNSCVEALVFVSPNGIRSHERYIKEKLLSLYKLFYESSDTVLAQHFRDAICYVDEVMNVSE